MDSSADLGARYMMLRKRYGELEQKCESAVRENKELRDVMVQILDQKNTPSINRGVQCDLLDFVGQRNLEQVLLYYHKVKKDALDGKDGDEKKLASRSSSSIDKDAIVERQLITEQSRALVQLLSNENRRLISSFSSPFDSSSDLVAQARADFSLYIKRKRESSDYLIDCLCFKGSPLSTDEKQSIEMGHFFIFKDHIEFITPSTQTRGDLDLFLMDIDEISAIEESKEASESGTGILSDVLVVGILETQLQSSSLSRHIFWEFRETRFLQALIVLKQRIFEKHIGKEQDIHRVAEDVEAVVLFENERKAVGWSGKFLLPGDFPNWQFQNMKNAVNPPSDESPRPPKGFRWVSEQWTIDSHQFVASIRDVAQGSPASLSGLRQGDLVMKYKSKRVLVTPQFQASFSSFVYALEAFQNCTLELIVLRPSEDLWIHAYLRPFSWKLKGFGLKVDSIDGWQYARSFNGPWSESCKWTHYVRRRKWVRYVTRLEVGGTPVDEKEEEAVKSEENSDKGFLSGLKKSFDFGTPVGGYLGNGGDIPPSPVDDIVSSIGFPDDEDSKEYTNKQTDES